MRRPWATITGVVVLTFFIGVLAGCGATEPARVVFTVEGMTCESCSAAITETLSKAEGVERASADHVSGSAEAVFVGPETTVEHLSAEIEGLGYTVTATKVTPVQG
jgi:copper chaperone CopZ